jgi:hypothetical protein
MFVKTWKAYNCFSNILAISLSSEILPVKHCKMFCPTQFFVSFDNDWSSHFISEFIFFGSYLSAFFFFLFGLLKRQLDRDIFSFPPALSMNTFRNLLLLTIIFSVCATQQYRTADDLNAKLVPFQFQDCPCLHRTIEEELLEFGIDTNKALQNDSDNGFFLKHIEFFMGGPVWNASHLSRTMVSECLDQLQRSIFAKCKMRRTHRSPRRRKSRLNFCSFRCTRTRCLQIYFHRKCGKSIQIFPALCS